MVTALLAVIATLLGVLAIPYLAYEIQRWSQRRYVKSALHPGVTNRAPHILTFGESLIIAFGVVSVVAALAFYIARE